MAGGLVNLGVLLIAAVDPALAGPSAAGLVGHDGPVRRPSDPIRIHVPGLAETDPGRLVLELDDIDVTDTVRREGEILVLTPVEPLAWGRHRLRLVERGPGDELVERGAWTIEIRHSVRLREAEASAEASLSGVRRVAEGGPEDPGTKSGSEGTGRVAGTVADGPWRLSAEAEFVHSSDPFQLPRERGVMDLGDFLLKGEFGSWWLTAGHHAPAPPSLIAQNLRRRGVSAGYGRPDDRLSAAAFALRNQEVAGFSGGLGAGDPGNRVTGLTVSAHPLRDRPDALVVSATWLDGREPGQVGEGAGGDTETQAEGQGASVALDGRLFDDRLQFQAELARTRYDFDGDGSAEARRDRAFSFRADYAALEGRMLGDEPAMLSVGVERRRIGTFFRSVADPTGVADRDLLRASGTFSWAGWDVQADLGRETDNVNGLALLPRVRSLQGALSVSYTPPPRDDPEAGPAWYGQPSWALNYVEFRQDVVRAGGGLTAGDFRDTDALSLSASFAYPAWNWSLSHTFGSEIDHAGVGADTGNAITELALYVADGDGPSVGLSVQRSRTEDRDAGIALTTETVALDLGQTLGTGLRASVGAAWNRDRSSDGAAALRTLDATGMLQWTVHEGGSGRPGVQLSLEGQRHRRRDRVDSANDAVVYRVHLRLTVSWASGR